MKKVRVRFPPSPTGIPHIGNTRTALFNYLFAKHTGGKFILRIEDTDRARLVPGAEGAIVEILDWLGLSYDEFYKQSERLELYQKAVKELLDEKLARQDDGAVYFIVPKGETISWTDAIGEKHISFNSNDIEDFVILKSDGFPTYHLANVVDDHAMEISHVIRGDEWISSVPKHILLYKAFGWHHPIFAHLPVIVGPDKAKLSKRHGAESILDYREKGYLKEALLNYMALLGWSPGQDREIMDMDKMIELFDLKDVNTASPMFDVNKLTWLNGQYIRQLSLEELELGIRNYESGIRNIDKKLLHKIIPLAQTRMKTLNDFGELVMPWFKNDSLPLNEKEKKIASKLVEYFLTMEQWNNGTILSAIKKILAEEDIKMPTIYKILAGKDSGLPIADMLAILGKEKTLAKLDTI